VAWRVWARAEAAEQRVLEQRVAQHMRGVLARHAERGGAKDGGRGTGVMGALLRQVASDSLERQVFVAWRAVAREGARKRRLLRRTLHRLAASQAWRALRQWRQWAVERAAEARQSAARADNDRLRASLVEQKRRMSAALISRWRAPLLRTAFDGWTRFVAERQRARDALRRGLVRSRTGWLRVVWHRWRRFVVASSREHLSAASAQQLATAQEQLRAVQRRASTLLARHSAHASVAACFTAWRRHTADMKARRRQHARVLQLLRPRPPTLAELFLAWREVARQGARVKGLRAELSEMRRRASQAFVSRNERATLARCFVAWRGATRAARASSALQQLQSSRQQLAQSLRAAQRRASQAMQGQRANLLVVRCFAAWKRFAAEGRQRRLRREAARESRTPQVAALTGGSAPSSPRGSDASFSSLDAVSAAASWRRGSVSAPSSPRTAQQQFVLAEHKRRTREALIAQWRTRTLVPAFTRWRQFAQQAAAERRERLQARRAGVSTSEFRITLNEETADLREKLRSHKRRAGEALIRQWRDAAVNPAFRAWRAWARERRLAKRTVLAKMFARLDAAAQRRAWRQWRAHAQQASVAAMRAQLGQEREALRASLAEQKRRMSVAIVSRWRNSVQGQAFHAWAQYAAGRRVAKLAALARVAARARRTAVTHAWRKWTGFASARQREELSASNEQLRVALSQQKLRSMHKIVHAWTANTVASVFSAWRRWAREQRARRREVLERTLQRLAYSLQWRALRQWRTFALGARAAESHRRLSVALGEQKRRAADALIARWRTQSVVPAFHAWAVYTRGRRARKRQLLDTSLRRLAAGKALSAWQRWRAFVAAARAADKESEAEHARRLLLAQVAEAKRRSALAVIARWRSQAVTEAFRGWREYVQSVRARRRETLRGLATRWRKTRVGDALQRWRRVAVQSARAEEKERVRRASAAVVGRWQRNLAATAFCAWAAHVRDVQSKRRDVLRRVVTRQRLRALRGGIAALRETASESRREAAEAQARAAREADQRRVEAEHERAKAALAAEKDALAALLREQKRRRAAELLCGVRRAALAPAMLAWSRFTRVARLKREEAATALQRRATTLRITRAWLQWRGAASAVVAARRAAAASQLQADLCARVVSQKRATAEARSAAHARATQTRAFMAWRTHVTARRRAKLDAARRLAARAVHARLASALGLWHEWARAQTAAAARTRLEATLDCTRERAAARVFVLRGLSLSSRVFHAWRFYARQQRLHARRDEALEALGRQSQTARARASLLRWHHAAHAARRKRELLQSRLAATLSARAQQTAASAFSAWSLAARLRVQRRSAVLRCLGRTRKRTLALATAAWRREAEARRELQRSKQAARVVARAAERVWRGRLARGLVRWRMATLRAALADAERAARDGESRARHEAAALREQVRELLARLSAQEREAEEAREAREAAERQLAVGEEAAAAQRRALQQRELERLAALRRHAALCRLFRAWAERAFALRRRSALLARALLRQRQLALRGGLGRWRARTLQFARSQLQRQLLGVRSENHRLLRHLGRSEFDEAAHRARLVASAVAAPPPLSLADLHAPPVAAKSQPAAQAAEARYLDGLRQQIDRAVNAALSASAPPPPQQQQQPAAAAKLGRDEDARLKALLASVEGQVGALRESAQARPAAVAEDERPQSPRALPNGLPLSPRDPQPWPSVAAYFGLEERLRALAERPELQRARPK
jgi:hypothetical protein